MKRLSILLILFSWTGFAQDTIDFLSFESYIQIVKENHPIAYQASLQTEIGAAKVLKAKGGFDPKIQGDASQKYFEDKQYYSHLHAGLKVPTWFGLQAQAGYDNNSGVRLNPELYTPEDVGLWYAGLTWDLGKGLFMDARRAELQQARIFQNSSELERRLMLNQLVFDASIAYWDWFKAYNKVKLYENAEVNAVFRLDAVRESAELGDKPPVDTLKALLQVQERQLYLEQTRLDLNNKRELLEVFLWQDGFIPLELADSTRPNLYYSEPATLPELKVLEDMDTLVANHPEILQSQNDIAISKIDFRLKREALKPVAQLKYNALSSPIDDNIIASYSLENYNWGATVVYPIFTRKERGDLKLTKLKIEEQEAKIKDKNAMIHYKIQAAFNQWLSSSRQIEISREATANYISLYEAEYTLFEVGESSLFLVNMRDQDQLDAQAKLIDIIYMNKISKALFNYQTVDY